MRFSISELVNHIWNGRKSAPTTPKTTTNDKKISDGGSSSAPTRQGSDTTTRKEPTMEKKKPGPKPKDPSLKKRSTTISLTIQEQQILEALANQRGCSASSVVAELIKNEASRIGV